MGRIDTLENGCIVEYTQEGECIRVTVWKPDRSLSVTALRPASYIDSEHHRVTLQEQAHGLLLHGTNPLLFEPTEQEEISH